MQRAPMSILVLAAGLLLGSQVTSAKGVVNHFSQAIAHSGSSRASLHYAAQGHPAQGKALGNALTGTAQAVTGIVAVPLLTIGSVGDLSQQAGRKLLDYSNKDSGPLPIAGESISAGPSPEIVMQIHNNKNNDKLQ